MKVSKVILTDRAGLRFDLSNEFPNVYALTDAIEDAKSPANLITKLKTINSYIKSFSIDRVTDTYTRVRCIAHMCDNEYVLVIYH